MIRLQHRHQPVRRGIAPLEFVMVMPILVFLFCLILYACRCCMISSTGIVATRNAAWKERFRDIGNNRFSLADASAFGKVTKKQSKPIKTGLYFDTMKHQATANTILITGTWDSKHTNSHIYMDISVDTGVLMQTMNRVAQMINSMKPPVSLTLISKIANIQGQLDSAINNALAGTKDNVNKKIQDYKAEVERLTTLVQNQESSLSNAFPFNSQQLDYLKNIDASLDNLDDSLFNDEAKQAVNDNKSLINSMRENVKELKQNRESLNGATKFIGNF